MSTVNPFLVMIPLTDQSSLLSLDVFGTGWNLQPERRRRSRRRMSSIRVAQGVSSCCDARRAPANSRRTWLTLAYAACEGSDWPNQLIPQLLILLEGPAGPWGLYIFTWLHDLSLLCSNQHLPWGRDLRVSCCLRAFNTCAMLLEPTSTHTQPFPTEKPNVWLILTCIAQWCSVDFIGEWWWMSMRHHVGADSYCLLCSLVRRFRCDTMLWDFARQLNQPQDCEGTRLLQRT